jgi:hypothetical protein
LRKFILVVALRTRRRARSSPRSRPRSVVIDPVSRRRGDREEQNPARRWGRLDGRIGSGRSSVTREVPGFVRPSTRNGRARELLDAWRSRGGFQRQLTVTSQTPTPAGKTPWEPPA